MNKFNVNIRGTNPKYKKFRDLKPGAIYNHDSGSSTFFMKVNETELRESYRKEANILTSGSCIRLSDGTIQYTSLDSDCFEYEVTAEGVPV